MNLRWIGPLAVAGVLAGSAVRADGFALNRYEPAERGSEWFSADSLDLRGRARPALGATFDWSYKPLLLRQQTFAHVGGAIVLWERLRLGWNLPLALSQSGRDPSGAAVGDLRLGVTARLVGAYGDPFQIAIGTWAFLPTGSRARMTSDGAARVHPHLLIAGDLSGFVYALRFGPTARFANREFEDGRVGTELSFAAGIGGRIIGKKMVLGPEAWGSTSTSKAFDRASTPLEVGVSAHWTEGSLRFAVGTFAGLSDGYGAPVARLLASFAWILEQPEPPPPDAPDVIRKSGPS